MADVVKLSRAFIDELEVSGEVAQMTAEQMIEILEYRVWNEVAVRRESGLLSGKASLEGVFNQAAAFDRLDNLHAKGGAVVGVSGYIRSATGAVAVGDFALLASAIISVPTMSFPQGDLARWGADFDTRGRLVAGKVLAIGQKTADGNEAGVQLGQIASGKKLVALLHAPITAAGTLVVTIQSDDNSGFTTPTTRLTFATLATTPTWQLLTLDGPITDDWWRVNLDTTLGDHTIGVAAGIA